MIKLTFIGDIMCQREQNLALARNGLAYDVQFEKVARILKASEYVVGNLETPIADEDLVYTNNDTIFNTPTAFAEALKKAGVNFVSLANNHCMDRGVKGLVRTIENVAKIGLDYDGAYLKQEESMRIFSKEIKGLRVAIVTGTYGQNSEGSAPRLDENDYWRVELLREPPMPPKRYEEKSRWRFIPTRFRLALRALIKPNSLFVRMPVPDFVCDNVRSASAESPKDRQLLERVLSKVRRAKEGTDIVISYPHIGGQYNLAPGAYAKRIVREMVKAGADVVVANHAHTSLRHEAFENGVKGFYALGNFCFTPGVGWYFKNVLADYSIVLHTFIDEKAKRIVRFTFSVVKSVVRANGVSEVVPVVDLAEELKGDTERLERLELENEAVVNRFAGWSKTVLIQEEYELA